MEKKGKALEFSPTQEDLIGEILQNLRKPDKDAKKDKSLLVTHEGVPAVHVGRAHSLLERLDAIFPQREGEVPPCGGGLLN